MNSEFNKIYCVLAILYFKLFNIATIKHWNVICNTMNTSNINSNIKLFKFILVNDITFKEQLNVNYNCSDVWIWLVMDKKFGFKDVAKLIF